MIAVYIRVSTVGQNEEGQRREIGKWLSGNGIDPTTVLWFTDKETGDNLNRTSFERLQKKVFDGQIKTIVCYKLDRISRSLRDGINVLCNWCERGIRVVSTSQQIDFNGTVGKMIASILFAIAELEQETRRERQAAGIAAAKDTAEKVAALREEGRTDAEIAHILSMSADAVRKHIRGVYPGRKKGAIKPGVDLARAAQLRAQGLTQEEIAKALGVSLSSARRYLKAAQTQGTSA